MIPTSSPSSAKATDAKPPCANGSTPSSNLSTQFESRILPVSLPIARTWGKMGTPNPFPTVDGLLAATAHVHGLVLATRNVTHVESLDIEWVNPFDPL